MDGNHDCHCEYRRENLGINVSIIVDQPVLLALVSVIEIVPIDATNCRVDGWFGPSEYRY